MNEAHPGNEPAPERFDAFMERALYDPKTGYYQRRIRGIGRSGDFTTIPARSTSLARAIATWAASAMRETGIHHLIEMGPGSGDLSAEVLRHLPVLRRIRTKLHLVETSPRLTELQKSKLGNRARWHTHPASALQACGGRAILFSNELVDAFPVRRFRKSAGTWIETGVAPRPDGSHEEQDLAETRLPPSSLFSVDFPENQRIEVHDSYRRWLDSWMPEWRAGRMLTIDYGDRAETVYHRRPHGTLRAYLLHQRLEGAEVLQHPGRQDLTADVNFSDLIEWTSPHLETRRLMSLAEFLGKDAPAECLDPHGAGGAFRVLEQWRRGPRETNRA